MEEQNTVDTLNTELRRHQWLLALVLKWGFVSGVLSQLANTSLVHPPEKWKTQIMTIFSYSTIYISSGSSVSWAICTKWEQ